MEKAGDSRVSKTMANPAKGKEEEAKSRQWTERWKGRGKVRRQLLDPKIHSYSEGPRRHGLTSQRLRGMTLKAQDWKRDPEA
jgi:hypothetical protein